MRILILGGAGLMGSGTIRDLLSPLSEGVEEVIACDSHPGRLEALKAQLPDPRLSVKVLDVGNRTALLDALGEVDLCINGVPTFAGLQMEIFEACLQARCAYTDYGGMGVYTVQQKAQHQRFVEKGVSAVIGLGADPGMSNVICRACADRLDQVDRINLYWTGRSTGPVSEALAPPYALSTILAEYANPSQQFLDGRLQEMPPRSGLEVLELPPPFGRTTFMFTQHSEPLTVPFSKGIAEKGIREFTWRLAFPDADHQTWLALVRAGFGDFNTPVSVRGVEVSPLEVLQAVIERNLQQQPEPRDNGEQGESYDLHFARGVGLKDGRATTVTVQVTGRSDPLYEGYVDPATSMNMSIGAQLMLAQPPGPGVWAAEEAFDVDRYLEQVRRRRFGVTIETVTHEGETRW